MYKKCPCESHENGEYFTSLMTKFVNTTHIGICISNHTLQATHLTPTFCFFDITSEIDCLGDYFLGPLNASTL